MADGGPPAVATGCRPLQGLPGLASLRGAIRSVLEPDGSLSVIVDGATVDGADVSSLSLTAPSPSTVDDCLASASVASGRPTSALGAGLALSGVATDSGPWLFSVQANGFGVSPQGPTAGLFTGPAMTLWTGDRPPYGSAALTSGSFVYAYGCLPARFLDADCFVARAPATAIADESGYAYYVGGGNWSPEVDSAWPVAAAGTTMDVAWIPGTSRWVMAYAPPLSQIVRMRSGLAPEGPWSAPVDVATCDLSDGDMFCAGIHLHPAIRTPSGSIALTYAPATLSPDGPARQLAEPTKWWPRLVSLQIPPLP